MLTDDRHGERERRSAALSGLFSDLERGSTLFDAFIVSKIISTTISDGDRAERLTGLQACRPKRFGHPFTLE